MTGHTADTAWFLCLESVRYEGHDIAPRGIKTREVLDSHIRINMQHPIIRNPTRKLNYRFMAAEAHWILTGDMRTGAFLGVCDKIREYSDNGVVFQGAYGPRVLEQLQYIMETLEADSSSRQAVIEIWRPMPRASRNIPCTVAMQFIMRHGRINTIVTMRSSDVWLGLPYDIFCFAMITQYLLAFMRQRKQLVGDLSLGTLCINAGSMHLYEANMPLVEKVLRFDNSLRLSPFVQDATPEDLIDWLHRSVADENYRKWFGQFEV